MHRALAVSFAAALVAGCTCGGDGDGPTSCSTRGPMLEAPRTVGRVTLTPEGRRLVVSGLPQTSRWVVGRGPALAIEPFAPVLDTVEAAQPDGVIILGSFGTGERLEELVAALEDFTVGENAVPVFFVPGPRDRLSELEAALARHPAPHLVSLAGVHAVALGAVTLHIAAGSVDARYVLEGGCHLADLDDVLDDASDDQIAVLVGFDAPAGTPLTAGLDGFEAGSAIVADAMQAAGVSAGIFAGPDAIVGRWLAGAAPVSDAGRDRRIIVPALVGAATEGADGLRAPAGATLVSFSPAGVGPATAVREE